MNSDFDRGTLRRFEIEAVDLGEIKGIILYKGNIYFAMNSQFESNLVGNCDWNASFVDVFGKEEQSSGLRFEIAGQKVTEEGLRLRRK